MWTDPIDGLKKSFGSLYVFSGFIDTVQERLPEWWAWAVGDGVEATGEMADESVCLLDLDDACMFDSAEDTLHDSDLNIPWEPEMYIEILKKVKTLSRPEISVPVIHNPFRCRYSFPFQCTYSIPLCTPEHSADP